MKLQHHNQIHVINSKWCIANHAFWPTSCKASSFYFISCRSHTCDPIQYIIVNTELTVTEDIIQATLACLISPYGITVNYQRSWTEGSLFYGVSVHLELSISTSEVQHWKDIFYSWLLLITFCMCNVGYESFLVSSAARKSTQILFSLLLLGMYTAGTHQGLLLGLIIPSFTMSSSCLLTDSV